MRGGKGVRLGVPLAIVAACLALAGWRIYRAALAPREQTAADTQAEARSQEQMKKAASEPRPEGSEAPAVQGGTKRLGSVGSK